MNKIRRTSANIVYEGYTPNLDLNKSPLKRNPNFNHQNTARSPLRSRTPTRHVSPIKMNSQIQPAIRFISNVSPIKERYGEFQNQGEFSNGKSIKYINNLINDKFYQSNKKDKNQEFNKKSDRNMPDQNRLFGKLVDKLNSEKKNGLKSNENSYKTSVFGETSETKSNRMEQTITKNQGVLTKSPYTKANREVRTETKNYEKCREVQAVEEQNLSCLVYKIKNASQKEEEMKYSKQKQVTKVADKNTSANVPSILMKRKISKNEEQYPREKENTFKNQNQAKEEQDFGQLNIFLKKIEQGCKTNHKANSEDDVKMSFKMQQSLSMDPFF